tara:strand:+ start:1015 stop:1272 length:258 start_codon:yes stop_codon:yes gene_type:complete
MNPHVELVRKWLADPESVSQEERKASSDVAWDAYLYALNALDDTPDVVCINACAASRIALYALTENPNTAKRYVQIYDELLNRES